MSEYPYGYLCQDVPLFVRFWCCDKFMSFDFYNTSAQLCVVGEVYGLIGHFVLYLEGFVAAVEKSNRITMLFTI